MEGLISFHIKLLNANERMQAFRDAIFKTVRSGDVVLDVGSGSGILALFACQAGARRIYAVEREDIISVARQMAKVNGFADRIVFLHHEVKELHLDERVDVVVSELVSKGVLGQKMAEVIGWCRDRFLKPGGRILPREVRLYAAPVEYDEIFQKARLPNKSLYGIDFLPFEQRSFHRPLSARIPAQAFLSPGREAYCYLAPTAPNTDRFDATLLFEVERAGTIHGFVTWFSSILAEGIELSNKPPGIRAWDNLFLPIAKPIHLEPGMTVELRMHGRDDSQEPNTWIWGTTIWDRDQILAKHQQSSIFGELTSAKDIHSRYSRTPTLNQNGRLAHLILDLIEQGNSVEEISKHVFQKFSGMFGTLEEASMSVIKIVRQFSE